MKSFHFSAAVLFVSFSVPTFAFADGFRCQGDGFRVKLYNQTLRGLGTRKPAVLVLSSEEEGVITVLTSDSLDRRRDASVVSYHGVGKQGPNAVEVNLSIRNEKRPEGDLSKNFEGELSVEMTDGYKIHAELECAGYLKGMK